MVKKYNLPELNALPGPIPPEETGPEEQQDRNQPDHNQPDHNQEGRDHEEHRAGNEPSHAQLEALNGLGSLESSRISTAAEFAGFPSVLVEDPAEESGGTTAGSDSAQAAESGESESGSSRELEIIEQPTEILASGGETPESLARKDARKFLGDSYDSFDSDPILMRTWIESYKKSIAAINGVTPEAVFNPGDKVTLPGISGERQPIFEKDGTVTSWAMDSTMSRDSEGTIRLDWYDGRYHVKRSDGTIEDRDRAGVTSTTRQLEDGAWLTHRSDGSYTRRNYDTGEQENKLADGTMIIIKDGLETMTYPDGSKSLKYPDNHIEYTASDGTVEKTTADGNSKKFDPDGNLIGQGIGWGRFKIDFHTDGATTTSTLTSTDRSEFRFGLTEGPDGIKLHETESGRTLEFPAGKDYEPVRTERESLIERAEQSIDDPIVLAKFKADMIRFESRARDRGLPVEQISGTYKSIGRLFENNDKAPIDADRREQIATELMSDIAEPYTISQGSHGTCNVKIMHVLMSAKDPEKLAAMISEVASTGEYTLQDGREIRIPAGTLSPARDALSNPRANGERGLAGQLFDSTVINSLLADTGAPYHLDQIPPGDSLKGYKSGDILVDNETGKPLVQYNGDVQEFAGISTPDIARAYELVMGDSKGSRDWLLDPNMGAGEHPGIKSYETAEQLHDILSSLKQSRDFPFAIRVDTKMPPFWEDSGAGLAGGSGGSHVLNITDYDPVTRKVMIDNQWATRKDRLTPSNAVPVDQLFRASLYPDKLSTSIIDGVENAAGPNTDRGLEIIRRLSQDLAGSNPTVLEGIYNTGALNLAGRLMNTTDGDDQNKDYREVYDGLRPSAKILVLDSLVTGQALGDSMSIESFNDEVRKLAGQFHVTEPDVLRQVRHNPQTLEEGKAAGIFPVLNPEVEFFNRTRLDVLKLVARLPSEQRDTIQNMIRQDVEARIAEAATMAGSLAE